MQDALALVRRELGPDAAVLHTREVKGNRLFGLLPGKPQVEITASKGVNVPSRLPERREERTTANSPLDVYERPRPATPPSLMRETRERAVEERSAKPVPRDVQSQLDDLQAMVKELCRRSQPMAGAGWSDDLFAAFASLIDADVAEDQARDLIERVRKETPEWQGRRSSDVHERLLRMIADDMQIKGPIDLTPGRRRVAALVGPTGVGKTTTVAKLAANFRLKEKRRVGLITVDTYRIAAVEQLRTYADIIELPMQVVSSPREMREAVRRMDDLDLVLIDTAGRSPRDEIRLKELNAFLSEASADEVHLTVSAAASPRALEQTAERFAEVGANALILTKLDEACGLGGALPLLRNSRLPVSYVTDGQKVPDDIQIADADRLAATIFRAEPSEKKMAAVAF